jgi:hypothetical protein
LLVYFQACPGLFSPDGTFRLVPRIVFRLVLLNVLNEQGFNAFAFHSGGFSTLGLDQDSDVRCILYGHFLNDSGLGTCFLEPTLIFQGSLFSFADQSFGFVQLALGLCFLFGKLVRRSLVR